MRKSAFAMITALLLTLGTSVYAEENITVQKPIIIDETSNQSQISPVLKDIQTDDNGEKRLIIKTYDIPPDYDLTLLESGFEKSGYQYQRGDMIHISDNFEKQKKLASQIVTLSHEKKDSVAGQFNPLLDYEVDKFVGQLKLETNSINTQSAGTKSYSYTMTDTKEYTGLERNDTYYISKTVDKNGVSLSLKDVQWTNMGRGGYRATAKYSGTATGSKPTGYVSTATYIGEVTKSTLKSVTYKVIYEGTIISPISPSVLPWVMLALGIVLCIAIAVLLFIYRKNIKIYGLLNGRYRIVKRQRVSYLNPTIDLTAVGVHVTCEEYIIAIDRLAVRNLHSQFVRILCEDGSIINRRIENDGNACKLHVSVIAHSGEGSEECED